MTPKQKQSILTSLNEGYYDLEKDPHNLIGEKEPTIARIVDFLHTHEVVQAMRYTSWKTQCCFQIPHSEEAKVNKTRATVLSKLLISLLWTIP